MNHFIEGVGNMGIVLYTQIIFFIMLGIGFYKLRQDKFDKVASIFIVIMGVILLILHIVLQVLTLNK